MSNNFTSLLIELGLSSADSIKDFHPRVRDTDKIKVLKCSQSGVLLLNDNSGGTEDNYNENADFAYWSSDWDTAKQVNQKEAPIFEDDHRRKEQFQNILEGKAWLDFGCGSGGLLRLMAKESTRPLGLEIQPAPRAYLNNYGIKCFESIDEIEDTSLDVVTLFHVYEHLPDPIGILNLVSSKLKTGGRLIIEVPQANDVLLKLFDLEAFKDFTFWSEHLILHTRQSLTKFVSCVQGLNIDSIQGYQRYPLSNHLYWLSKSLPGGHYKWSFLNTPDLEQAYSRALQANDLTDTLIAYITKQ